MPPQRPLGTDEGRVPDSGVGGTLRVLHGPGGMGIAAGVLCRVEVRDADGVQLDAAEAGELGKEHRQRDPAPGDRVEATVSARHLDGGDAETTTTRTVVLTGDLDDVVLRGTRPRLGGGWPEWTPASCRGSRRPRHWSAGAPGCGCAGPRDGPDEAAGDS